VQSAVGQFQAAGSNMGAALAAGLRSQLGAVQAAAAALAQAAAAGLAAAAQIRSPSRVFIGLGEMIGAGFVIGLNSGQNEVEKAGRDMANAVIDATDRAKSAFETDTWAASFNARVNTALAQVDLTAAGGRAATGGVTVNTIINNPAAESGSDSVAKVNRRQAALGLFG
jgi:hypothetical protein